MLNLPASHVKFETTDNDGIPMNNIIIIFCLLFFFSSSSLHLLKGKDG